MSESKTSVQGSGQGFAGHSGVQSASRYGDPGLAGFISRSFAKSMGFSDETLRRPVIGIAQTWSEFNNCHQHFRELAEAVKRGVWQTEEMIRAQPIDAVVLLASCDKTIPEMLMGAASADVPTILLTGGPTLSGRWNGKDLGADLDFLVAQNGTA